MHSAEPRSAYADIHNVVCSYQMAERRRKGRGKEKESRSNEGPAAPRLWASSRVFAPRLAPTAAHRFLSGAPHALHGSPHLLFTSVDVPPSPPPSFLLLLLFLFRSLLVARAFARSLALSLNQGRREYARDASLAKYRRRVFPMTIARFRHSWDDRVHLVSQNFGTCLIFLECVSIAMVLTREREGRSLYVETEKQLGKT